MFILPFALLFVSAAALKTSFPSAIRHTTRATDAAHGSKSSLQALPVLSAQPILSNLVGIPVMYALFSFNEYVTHRWYQHNEIGKVDLYKMLRKRNLIPKIDGGGHVEHHAETYDDMSLKTEDPVWMAAAPAQRLNRDLWRGTAFTWPSTSLMILQCIPTVYPVFMLGLGWSAMATTAFYLFSMALHGLIWNAIHPEMHGLPEVGIRYGFPSKWLSRFNNTWFFKYLHDNHVGHHVAGGQANYNVCCPGMDFVMQTSMKKAEWLPKVRDSSDRRTREIAGALTSDQM